MVHTKTTPKASHSKPIPPLTPSLALEPSPSSLLPRPASSVRRRSLRLLLASRMDVAARPLPDSSPISRSGGSSFPEDRPFQRKISPGLGASGVSRLDGQDMGLDSSGNEIRDLEPAENTGQVKVELFNEMSGDGSDSCHHGSTSWIPAPKSSKAKRKWELSIDVHLNSLEWREDERSKGCLNLRSGKTIPKRGTDTIPMDKTLEKSECQGQSDDIFMNGASINKDVAGGSKRCRKMRNEDKGNKKLHMDASKSVNTRQSKGGGKGKGMLVGASEKSDVIEDVDEGLSCDDFLPNGSQEVEMGLESSAGGHITEDINHLEDDTASQVQQQLINMSVREYGSRRNEHMERFRDIARANASRYAHFAADEEHDRSTNEAEVENETEDWPGPFSTAMKIIKDRALKSTQTGGVSSGKSLPIPIKWVPKRNQGQMDARFSIPSLQELCLNVLAKHADAIVSLNNVPDALRHKLSQLLCNCRKMNGHFFELLISGSPMEIRLSDCSWMTEEQFTKSFQMCNTASLTVCSWSYVIASSIYCNLITFLCLDSVSYILIRILIMSIVLSFINIILPECQYL